MGDRSVSNALVIMSQQIKEPPTASSDRHLNRLEVSHLQRTRRRGKDRMNPLGLLAAAAQGLGCCSAALQANAATARCRRAG